MVLVCQLVSSSGKDTSVAELDCVDTSTEVARIDCTDTSGSVAELPCKGNSSDFIFGRIGRASVSLVHRSLCILQYLSRRQVQLLQI